MDPDSALGQWGSGSSSGSLGVKATGEVFIHHFKTWNCLTFFYYSGSSSSSWIRIRILLTKINRDPCGSGFGSTTLNFRSIISGKSFKCRFLDIILKLLNRVRSDADLTCGLRKIKNIKTGVSEPIYLLFPPYFTRKWVNVQKIQIWQHLQASKYVFCKLQFWN